MDLVVISRRLARVYLRWHRYGCSSMPVLLEVSNCSSPMRQSPMQELEISVCLVWDREVLPAVTFATHFRMWLHLQQPCRAAWNMNTTGNAIPSGSALLCALRPAP